MENQTFKTRYNVMDIPSLTAFANIKGGMNGNCKDVYFIRAIGGKPSCAADLEAVDRMLTQRMAAGQCKYARVEGLPRLAGVEEAAYYSAWYEEWIASGKCRAGKNEDLQTVLGEACNRVLHLFQETADHANASMEKNFVVKLLYWFDRTGAELTKNWNPRSSMKFVIQNISKKQEYLFCYLLTLLGVDVLLLQTKTDIEEKLEKMNLSKKLVLGSFGDYHIPVYHPETYLKSEEKKEKIDSTQKKEAQRKEEPEISTEKAAPVPEVPNRTPVRLDMQTVRKTPAVPKTKPSESGSGEMEFEELALLASSIVMIKIHNKGGEVIGSGSGIMIGRDGYILTNNHVASGGHFYSVRIEDEENTYQTDEVIKYNPVLDLAVIRIDRKLAPLPVYKGTKKLVRGQKVVAIGSPLGLFNTVSDGIISGFRIIDGVDMIQFTAPISHGSSGGAVLNMRGEVIGISTAGIDDGQNLNLAVGYENIRNFIRGFT